LDFVVFHPLQQLFESVADMMAIQLLVVVENGCDLMHPIKRDGNGLP
jgi:hypothetical protein